MVPTWRIYEDLRTTYTDSRVQDGAEQPCGKPEENFGFDDVLAWAARETQPWEGALICTTKGIFFVQPRKSLGSPLPEAVD